VEVQTGNTSARVSPSRTQTRTTTAKKGNGSVKSGLVKGQT
jgi:hypothetical protein